MLQIAGNCALRQKHKDKKIRTHLAKTRTKESTAFRFGSSQVVLRIRSASKNALIQMIMSAVVSSLKEAEGFLPWNCASCVIPWHLPLLCVYVDLWWFMYIYVLYVLFFRSSLFLRWHRGQPDPSLGLALAQVHLGFQRLWLTDEEKGPIWGFP